MSESAKWIVRRQPRSGHAVPSRVVYEGHDEAAARAAYERIAKTLRQGSVKLFGPPDGFVLARTSAPNLRTRW